MKETKQAKENVDNLKILLKDKMFSDRYKTISASFCVEHKQTCQRWLEFLGSNFSVYGSKADEKIKDLKQAIKIYEEAGI